ncbi:unnamed protein product [Menidia menidia]|uniref:(Atlantic silverside) hypothetical protein n=1 Tax=Menidia menidia TaxID=238744 RepID=A0A8S4BU40_9TELE|nr:unnamed protein product [Menidia menidia]
MGHGTPFNMNLAGLVQSLLLLVHIKQLTCGSIQFVVPEELEPGTLVGTLGKLFQPPYKLLTQEYMWMDTNTGNIYTTEQKMDREFVCPEETKAEECIIPHSVVVGPSGDLIQFHVIIEDINDNAPQFENSEIHLRVSEDTAVGTSFLLDDQAQDRDIQQNGKLQYHLQGSEGTFTLNIGQDGFSIMLVVQTALDRETQELYKMQLVVTDCGAHPLSASAALIVTVTDVDDNCPSFSSDSPQTVTIQGDSPQNMVVTQVTATDPDTGPNAAIIYSLSPKVSERAKKLFSLDRRTGYIRLAQDLHSDKSEEVVLKVLASGPHCPPANTQVTVSVLPKANQELMIKVRSVEGSVIIPSRQVIKVLVADVNDNAPLFPVSHYQLSVEENNQPGMPLLQVSASDADSGNNSRVTYRLEKNTSAIFHIDSVTGQLSVSAPLDREQQDVHKLTVFAGDSGSPPLESQVTVIIRILDQNDNAPVFLTSHFIFFIPENVSPLSLVGSIEVKDPDEGENGSIELHVVNSTAPFVVDNARGTLRTTSNLDRETEDRHELHVLATDNGHPVALTSIVRVTVFVEDMNDNQPKVILPSSNSSCQTVSPGTLAGTVVAKIYAIDEDSGLNSEIMFSIVASEPAQKSSPFQVDLRSGNITLSQQLLPIDMGMHNLFVIVRDNGKPTPLYTTVWVNLLVNESLENCYLDRAPAWTGTSDLVQSPSKAPICKVEIIKYAQAIFITGLCMLLASASLLLVSTYLFLKNRSLRNNKNGHRGENMIPLRLKEKYLSEE